MELESLGELMRRVDGSLVGSRGELEEDMNHSVDVPELMACEHASGSFREVSHLER